MNYIGWILAGIAAVIVIGFLVVAVYTLKVMDKDFNEEEEI